MSTKVAAEVELAPFARFLRAHAAIIRELSTELEAEHGLTINDYEVLLRLSRAEDRRMRRVDLAQEVLLTPSGITRLLEGLDRGGLVERAACETDGRVVYACLTDAGMKKLRAASKTHVAGIRRRFLERFDEEELEMLSEFFGRLADGGDTCTPD